MVVEDNEQILKTLKLILEFNDFEAITAVNGIDALAILSTLEIPPDLILCDIMMPKMGGYDFFQKVSENPKWQLIPFIFVTAKADPEDIRFGKQLGVDDYVTKPFKEKDLLAIIAGKLQRNKRIKAWKEKIEDEILKSIEIDQRPSISKEEEEHIFLFQMMWDETMGPKLKTLFPNNKTPTFDLDSVGTQLFQTTVSIYGHTGYLEPQGVLLRIANINQDGYLFFYSEDDESVRGGKRLFMLALIAPRINYLESLRINEIFEEIPRHIEKKSDWDLKNYWLSITEVLNTPSIDID